MQSINRLVSSKWAVLAASAFLLVAQIAYLTIFRSFERFSLSEINDRVIEKPIVHEGIWLFIGVIFLILLVRQYKKKQHMVSVISVFVSGLLATIIGYSVAFLATTIVISVAFFSVFQTLSTLKTPPAIFITDPVKIIEAIGTTVPQIADTARAVEVSTFVLHNHPIQSQDTFYYNVAIPIASNVMWLSLLNSQYPPVWYIPEVRILATVRVTEPTLRQVVAPLAKNAIIRKYGAYIRAEESFSVVSLNTKQYIDEVNKRQEQYIQRMRDSLDEIRQERSQIQSTIASNNLLLTQVPPDDPYYNELKQMVALYNGDMYGYIAELDQASTIMESQLKAVKDNPLTADRQAGLYSGTVVYLRYFDEESIYNQMFERYYSTAVHEYLHALSSHGAETDNLEPFMEEGITDYLTGEIISEAFYPKVQEPWYGYEGEVALMKGIMADVTEPIILKTYFSKQEENIIPAFNKAYPGTDYETFKKEATLMHLKREDDEIKARKQAEQFIIQLRQGVTLTPGLPISQ